MPCCDKFFTHACKWSMPMGVGDRMPIARPLCNAVFSRSTKFSSNHRHTRDNAVWRGARIQNHKTAIMQSTQHQREFR